MHTPLPALVEHRIAMALAHSAQDALRIKRAGTSPVNAVVRETIMERQVHFQSLD